MKWNKLLPAVGIILFIYIIYSIGLNKIFISFNNLKIVWLIPAIIFIIFNYLMLVLKWKKIIKTQGFNISFKEALFYYMKGNFYGFITPSRAGSLIRATYLKKKTQRPLIECASGIVIERFFDIVSIATLATIGAIALATHLAGLSITILLILAGLFVVTLFFSNKKRAGFFFRILYKFLVPKKFKEKARNSFYSFYESLPPLKKLVFPLILTPITWIMAYTHLYFFARMFNIINIPIHHFIILVPISTIIGMIPITMSGLGTREATLITLFKLYGVSSELALSMSITGLIIGAAIPAFIGFLLTLRKE